VDIHEQGVRFVVTAAQGVKPFSFLCAELGISRPTGYLWLRRHKKLGARGIIEQVADRSSARGEPMPV
jgi:hypothetical protein